MKQKITSIGSLLVGLLLAVGPQFIFKPCPTTEKFMKCFWSCKALIAVGTILAVISLFRLIAKQAETQKYLALCGLLCCVFAILIPTVIIGGCAKADMICKVLTFPVTHSISVIGIILNTLALLSNKNQIS